MRRKEWSSTKRVALSVVVSPGLFVFAPRIYVVGVDDWKKPRGNSKTSRKKAKGKDFPEPPRLCDTLSTGARIPKKDLGPERNTVY